MAAGRYWLDEVGPVRRAQSDFSRTHPWTGVLRAVNIELSGRAGSLLGTSSIDVRSAMFAVYVLLLSAFNDTGQRPVALLQHGSDFISAVPVRLHRAGNPQSSAYVREAERKIREA